MGWSFSLISLISLIVLVCHRLVWWLQRMRTVRMERRAERAIFSELSHLSKTRKLLSLLEYELCFTIASWLWKMRFLDCKGEEFGHILFMSTRGRVDLLRVS